MDKIFYYRNLLEISKHLGFFIVLKHIRHFNTAKMY